MAIKNVFVTGGTGLVGTEVTNELLKHGYILTGLARSDESAEILKKKNITPIRGSLTDLDILKKAAKEADATIHLGFIHDFNNFEQCCQTDRAAVTAIVQALEGTNKTFVGTGGLLKMPEGPMASMVSTTRMDTWKLSLSYASKGVRVIQVNLPPSCHGENDHAFIPMLIQTAKQKNMAVYPGDGSNKWSAANKSDLAVLYRLALEQAESGTTVYGDAELISSKAIATAIGKKLDIPVKSVPAEGMLEAAGFIGMMLCLDSHSTDGEHPFGWKPTHSTLVEDIENVY